MKTTLKILNQGAVIVNHGFIAFKSPEFVAIEIQLGSKYCDVIASGGCDDDSPCPLIYLESTEDSIDLNESVPTDSLTEIEFSEFPGYEIWTSGVTKYNLRVCLIKQK